MEYAHFYTFKKVGRLLFMGMLSARARNSAISSTVLAMGMSLLAACEGVSSNNSSLGDEAASATSTASSSTSTAVAPTAVTITSITPGDTQTVITWTGGTGATSFTVNYGTAPGNLNQTASVSATSPYTVTGLVNGTTYYFNVVAVNSTGSSPVSNTSSTTPDPVPGAFTISSAVSGTGTIVVTFGVSSGAVTYTVKHGTATGSYATTDSANATSPYTITGLLNDSPYYVMVTAVNPSGSRDATAEATVTPSAIAPAPSVPAGAYSSAQSVALTSTTASASIYYTTDGSTPTAGSTLYTVPISISATGSTTLKSIAIKAGVTSSSVTSTAYYLNTGITCTTTAAANWNVGAGNWDCGHIPIAGDAVVIAHDTTIPAAFTMPVIYDLTINASKTLTQSNALLQTVGGTLTVNGTLTHTANTTTHDYSVKFSAAAINVAVGGSINVDYKGYAGGAAWAQGKPTDIAVTAYPGRGRYLLSGTGYSAGGGHGGNGGTAGSAAGGTAYCDITNPSTLGASGAGMDNVGGAGGGLIQLTATGTVTLNGTISGRGTTSINNQYGGGGAGGGVKIVAADIAGTPTSFTVAGGSATTSDGSRVTSGGGGGCVLISYTGTRSIADTGITLQGGAGGTGNGLPGGGGVAYFRKTSVPTSVTTQDTLVSSNNDQTSSVSNQAATSISADVVKIYGGSIYSVGSGSTLTLTSQTSLVTGASAASLKINGGTLTTPASFTIPSGVTLMFHQASTWTSLASTAITNSGTLDLRDYTTLLSFAPSSLTIVSGGILTHGANTTTGAGQTHVAHVAAGTLDVQLGGTINVDSKGYAGGASYVNGNGPAAGIKNGGFGGGAGHGGSGGAGNDASAFGGTANCDISNPATIGSGGAGGNGGAGAAGGGLVILNVTGTFTLNGTISANGGNGTTWYGGGGAGGGLKLVADTIAGSPAAAAISLTGGVGADSSGGGGAGGGGCALVQYTTSNTVATSTFTLNGGVTGNVKGGAGVSVIRQGASGGTLFVTNAGNSGANSPQTATSLTVDYVNVTGSGVYQVGSGKTLILNQVAAFTGAGGSGSLQINGGTLTTQSSLTVSASETLIFHQASTWTNLATTAVTLSSGTLDLRDYTTALAFTASSLTIASGGILTHGANTTAQTHVVNVAAGTLDVQASGTINVDSKGYAGGASYVNGNGPAAGIKNGGRGGGAGHGGNGGVGNDASAFGGTADCNIADPATIGSGGAGGNGGAGAAGGGLVILNVTGTFTLNGTISANGGNGTVWWGGGGAGGGMKLVADTIAGSPAAGSILLTGGTGHIDGGGGGGGCARMEWTTANLSTITSGSITVTPGNGFAAGSVGLKAVVP